MVDPDGLAVQVGLQGTPDPVNADAIEKVGQSIIVKIAGLNGFPGEGGQSKLMLLNPRRNMAEAMIALGKDKEKPQRDDFASSEWSLPKRRGRQMAIQEADEADPPHNRPQERADHPESQRKQGEVR